MTVREIFLEIKSALANAHIESARLEAERLLAQTLSIPTSELTKFENKSLDEKQIQFLRNATERRARGEPFAYILQRQGFYKHEFIVRPGVLIPRPETEHVVEAALELIKPSPVEFADLGCGSGCIGLSLLKEWPDARLTAIDVSEIAASTTLENAKLLDVGERCEIVRASVEELTLPRKFDLIVANPPYISPTDKNIESNVKNFEPHQALFADENGLAAIRLWSEKAMSWLQPGGFLILEIGAGQKRAVFDTLSKLGFKNLSSKMDLAGHERVIIGRS